MIQYAAGILMIIAGVLVSLFMPRDALSFPIVQMVIAVFIFTAIVLILAFWPDIKQLFKRNKK